MKLIRLRLENFRQHRDTDIRFGDGMTAIVGENGTGKTSILEAITFAFYGVQRKTKDGLRFFWAGPREKVRVTLDFEFDERLFVLERTTTTASLVDVTRDPEIKQAVGLREVKAACEKLLRLTYDQFKNSFCAEQKGLAFLQFNTDTRRQEQVAKMLGFDRLKGASELARDRGKSFRSIAAALESAIGNLEDLKSQRALLQGEVARAEEAGRLAAELVATLQEKLPASSDRKAKADAYARLSQEMERYASNADVLKSSKNRAEQAVEKAQADVTARAGFLPGHEVFLKLEIEAKAYAVQREQELEREKRQAELDRIESEHANLTQQIGAFEAPDLEGARKAVRTAAAAHADCLAALRAAEAAWSRDRQSAQVECATAASELRQARAAHEKAKELVAKGVCPECGQPTNAGFEEKLGILEAAEAGSLLAFEAAEAARTTSETRPKAVFDAEDAVEAALKAHEGSQAALTEAEKLATQLQGLVAQRDACAAKAEALRTELAGRAAKYDRAAHHRVEQELIERRPDHEAYLKLAGAEDSLKGAKAQLEAARLEIEAARTQYTKVLQERKNLPFKSSEEASTALIAHEALVQQVRDAEANVKIAATLTRGAQDKLKQAKERIQECEKTEVTLKQSRTQALLHEAASEEMKRLREELNSVIRPDLESRASDNLSVLTNGRYPILELDDEFNATVVEDGIAKQVISGGEEDVVALALRMALSELIQERQGRPMSLLILDEVFGSLDADRRQALLERLQAIKGRFAQILVISHIEEINQVADQCIFLRRDEKTRSTVIGDAPIDVNDLVLA